MNLINQFFTWLLSVSYDTGVFEEGTSDRLTWDDLLNMDAIRNLDSEADRNLMTIASGLSLILVVFFTILFITLPFLFL